MGSSIFPNLPLRSGTPVADAFLHYGCTTYRAAADYIHRLPYGRNSVRTDVLLVLAEGRGTCSSKHALLALLAREQSLPVELILGIYAMNSGNTPGIADVLRRHHLPELPEAHCILRYNGHFADLTRRMLPPPPLPAFLYEERIEPEQVANYKVQLHRRYMHRWCTERALPFAVVWQAREECIAALGAV